MPSNPESAAGKPVIDSFDKAPETGAVMPAFYRRLVGWRALVLCGAVLAIPGVAAATDQEEAPAVPKIEQCGFNYMTGPDIACPPADIPVACLGENLEQKNIDHQTNLGDFVFDPAKLQIGAEMAREHGGKSSRSSGRVELAFQDDLEIVDNALGHREETLFLMKLAGGTVVRVTIEPHRLKDPETVANYRAAAEAIVKCEMEPQFTLSCHRQKWNGPKFRRYVRQAKRFFGDIVHRWTICNEPNDEEKPEDAEPANQHKQMSGWLIPMPGKSLACTYRNLYAWGRGVLRRKNPKNQNRDDQVLLGDLSSGHRPLVYLRKVIKCRPPKKTNAGKALETEGVAYHPYVWIKGRRAFNLNNKKTKWNSVRVGIDSLKLVNREIIRAHKKGNLQTPDGKLPGLYLTEYGQGGKAPDEGFLGKKSIYNMRPTARLKHYVQVKKKICSMRNIKEMLFYQMDRMPDWRRAVDNWYTGLVDAKGRLTRAYYGISSFVRQSDSCFR